MPVPTDIISQLRRDEGVRKFPYLDTVNKLTIGVGRNLTDVGLSDMEINFLLRNDVFKAQAALTAKFPWFAALDDARRGVLVNMAFNLGADGLAEFHLMLQAVQNSDWATAAKEMLNSLWAKQVGDQPPKPGDIGGRAWRLSQQMATGQWM